MTHELTTHELTTHKTSTRKTATQAIIYCRVSSVAQVEEGHGLESQETRCREYAHRKGYEVVETFYEKAVSGGVQQRPSFTAMLNYIRDSKLSGVVIIIDDISRFARDIEGHWALRHALKDIGGKLESPQIKFGEDSDSVLVENLLASVSQHQRQKNGEQTKNRMRARALNGYWVFRAPIGLRYQKTPGHGNLLVRDEPIASIVQEALEGFATGRFETQSEVKRFLDNQPAFPKDKQSGEVRFEEVSRLMRRPHYAGYLEVPEWNVPLRKGQHEGLISYETFVKVQDRLNGTGKAPARKDVSEDFPLRGFILCGECNNPLTANWSKSKTGKKHPYYLCFHKGCESNRKSIRKSDLEGSFRSLLTTLQPKEELFALAKAMFKNAWEQRLTQTKAQTSDIKQAIARTDADINQLLDRIVETNNAKVVSAYETRIEKLEKEKRILEEKLTKNTPPAGRFNEMFELATAFLASPQKLWDSGQIHWQRTVLRLAFVERLAYSRKTGLRTPDLALPFKVLQAMTTGENKMAEREGFEPSIRDKTYTPLAGERLQPLGHLSTETLNRNKNANELALFKPKAKAG